MESLNIVVMNGLISGDAVPHGTGCNFSLKTIQISKVGGEKVRHVEYHNIHLRNPGTIMKYLTSGKSVLIKGRLGKEEFNGELSVGVLADSVTFPALKDTNE